VAGVFRAGCCWLRETAFSLGPRRSAPVARETTEAANAYDPWKRMMIDLTPEPVDDEDEIEYDETCLRCGAGFMDTGEECPDCGWNKTVEGPDDPFSGESPQFQMR
jgi:hypothetical protein